MGHIDPATGRNRRESGRLARLSARVNAALAAGRRPRPSGAIRMNAGKPTEKRIDQKRRNRVYPAGKQR